MYTIFVIISDYECMRATNSVYLTRISLSPLMYSWPDECQRFTGPCTVITCPTTACLTISLTASPSTKMR